MRPHERIVAVSALCWLVASTPCGAEVGARTAEPGDKGVVVLSASARGSAAAAGITAGDVLMGWVREANPPASPERSAGSFSDPLLVRRVEIGEAPRGELWVHGLRGGERFETRVQPGLWRVTLAPREGEAEHASRSRALEEAQAGNLEDGLKVLEQMALAA